MENENVEVIEKPKRDNTYLIFLGLISVGIALILLTRKKKPNLPIITPIKHRTKTKVIVVDTTGKKLKSIKDDELDDEDDNEEKPKDLENEQPNA